MLKTPAIQTTPGRFVWAVLLAAALATLAPSAVQAQAPHQPEAGSGFAAKPAVWAPRMMVVTANPYATEAALAALREGGSAVDAAIAAALVLNVVEPQSSGIGGGGFLLHYSKTEGRVSAWDGRETAPADIDETLFLDPGGAPLAFHAAAVGGRAVGVPGLLRLLEAVHARHGRLSWARLFAPAIGLAQNGFPVSPRLHALIARDRFLAQDANARALFFDEEGAALAVGARLRNPQLAALLRTVAEEGAGAFYRGPIAHDIVAAARAAPNSGRLAVEDLAEYRALEREPLCSGYRAHRVCGMPPPSSGGGTVLALLGILEHFSIPRIAADSAFAAHLFAEAGRLAFADRNAWYGDPAFMPISPEALIDPAYLARRAEKIRLATSLGQALPGLPPRKVERVVRAYAPERPSTSHLSIVDRDGNAVALTASIEDAFGSRRMVRGFLLNNQLTDFSFQPADARGPHPNRVGPRKRPRSSMAPTMVFDPDGRLHAVSGSPGGSHIINYVAASVVGLVDWRMAPDELLARPHAGSRNGPTEVEDTAAGRALVERLGLFGHEPVLRDLTSGLALVVRSGEGWLGAADPRREGVAAGD